MSDLQHPKQKVNPDNLTTVAVTDHPIQTPVVRVVIGQVCLNLPPVVVHVPQVHQHPEALSNLV